MPIFNNGYRSWPLWRTNRFGFVPRPGRKFSEAQRSVPMQSGSRGPEIEIGPIQRKWGAPIVCKTG